MGRLIVAMVSIAAVVAVWISLLIYEKPRQVETVAAVAGDPVIAEYLRHRSEGHLVGRYH